jgi:hypothetical protein
MGAYSRTYSLTDGTTAYGSQVAFELDALGSSANNIVNAQIASNANIADSKLAQITTASKVSGAALTSLGSIPSGAGTIPLANLASQIVSSDEVTAATDTTTTSTSYADLNTMSLPAFTPGAATNVILIFFTATGKHESENNIVSYILDIGGNISGTERNMTAPTNTTGWGNVSIIHLTSLAASSQTIKVQWKVPSGTGTTNARKLSYVEFKA